MSYVKKVAVTRILDQMAADAAANKEDDVIRRRVYGAATGAVQFAYFANLIDEAEYRRRGRALRCSEFGEEIVAEGEARRRAIACAEGRQP